jgi:hypothetical protein
MSNEHTFTLDDDNSSDEEIAAKRSRSNAKETIASENSIVKTVQLYNSVTGLDVFHHNSSTSLPLTFEDNPDVIEEWVISAHPEVTLRDSLIPRLTKLYQASANNATLIKLLDFNTKCYINNKELSVDDRKALIMKNLLTYLVKLNKFFKSFVLASFDTVNVTYTMPNEIIIKNDFVANNDYIMVCAVRFEKPATFTNDSNKQLLTNTETCIALTTNNQLYNYLTDYLKKYVDQKNEAMAKQTPAIMGSKMYLSPAEIINNKPKQSPSQPLVAGDIRFYLTKNVVRKVLDEDGSFTNFQTEDKKSEKLIQPGTHGLLIGDKIGFRPLKTEPHIIELRVYCGVVIVGSEKSPL